MIAFIIIIFVKNYLKPNFSLYRVVIKTVVVENAIFKNKTYKLSSKNLTIPNKEVLFKKNVGMLSQLVIDI